MICCKCGFDKDNINITIRDAKGETTYCPNCLASAYLDNALSLENIPDVIDDVTGEAGAVEFIAEGEYYALEAETMLRLIACELDQDEYLALAQKYGTECFMIHSDFYCEDGTPVQPLRYL